MNDLRKKLLLEKEQELKLKEKYNKKQRKKMFLEVLKSL